MYKFILAVMCIGVSFTIGYSTGVEKTIKGEKSRTDKTISQQVEIIQNQYIEYQKALENSHKEQYQKAVQSLASAYNTLHRKDIENFNKVYTSQVELNRKLMFSFGAERFSRLQNARTAQNQLFKQQQVINSLTHTTR